MEIHQSHSSDPWHIDILFTVIEQTLASLSREYHQNPQSEPFYCTIAALYAMLDALVVQIPDPNPLRLRPQVHHPHLRAKQLQHPVVQTKRE